MYPAIAKIIAGLPLQSISEERKAVLRPLADFVRERVSNRQKINISFICTHNSRRSHLAQVWAQAASFYFNVPDVCCYSGGTEETSLFPKVAATLADQGFVLFRIAEGNNPVYAIKYSANAAPVIGFSKKFNNPFNPVSGFAAVLTCSQADEGCPFIAGAGKRIPITYEDPKVSDHSPEQTEVYAERSLEIATEMCYVFSRVSKTADTAALIS